MKKYIIIISFILLCLPFGVNASNKIGYNNAVNLTIRSTASTSGTKVGVLPIGTNIEILATSSGNGCKTWYKFKYNGSDAWGCGITTSGVEYIKTYTTTTLRTSSRTASTDYEKELEKKGFPSSYWDKLSALHKLYPNWNFVANKTNINFDTAVSKEISDVDNNLIYVSNSDMNYVSGYLSTSSGSYNYKTNTFTALDSGTFYSAKKEIVAYYMDPRNFLNESFIFTFEQLSYNSSYHTESLVGKTFGSNFLKSYKSNYYNAGKKNNVSPVHLATRSMLELGSSSSFLTTGESFKYTANHYKNYSNIYNKTFSKCYNFYNIGAYADTKPAQNAAIYACGGSSLKETSYNRPWNTADKAINGGASFIGSGYIDSGQDTLYFQKFNTASYTESSKYTHQYMQNIQAPSTEGSDTFDGYEDIGIINSSQSFTFVIPVYNNMPETTSLPNSKNPNNYLKSISVTGGGSTKSVSNFDGAKTDNNYTVELPSSTTSVTISTTKVTSSSTVTVNSGNSINLSSTSSVKVPILVKAANGDTRTYYVTVKKSLTGIDSKVSSAGYSISSSYLSKINLKTSISTLTSNIKKKDSSASISVKDKSNKSKSTSSTLVTGDKVTVTSGSDSKTYTVVVYGDVNGDGKINSGDLLKLRQHLLGTSKLSGAYSESADINKDKKINSGDLLKTRQYLLGTYTITQ